MQVTLNHSTSHVRNKTDFLENCVDVTNTATSVYFTLFLFTFLLTEVLQ
jgi:hypothetical protein